jgi:inactive STAND
MTTDPDIHDHPSGISIIDGKIDTGGGDIVGRDKVTGDKVVIGAAFFGAVGAQPPERAGAPLRRPPRLLPYLTDRTEQQRRLTTALQAQIDRGSNKPLTFFVIGSEDECLDSFVEQVRIVRLPAILESNGLPREILYRSLQWAGSDVQRGMLDGEEVARQLEGLRDQLYDALAVKTTADKSLLEQRLTNSPATLLIHVGLSLAEWGASQTQLMAFWLRWLNALDLSKARKPIVTLVSIIYPSSFFYRLFSRRSLAVLRRNVLALANDPDFGATVHPLPELGSVRFDDVEQWIREYVENVDREALRRLIRGHFSIIFGFGDRSLSMYRTAEIVKAALNDPSVRMGVL